MGKYIVFGGLDQTGKSTQAQELVNHLRLREIPVILTHEPTGTEFGKRLKSLMKHHDLSAHTQWLMYLAARQHHIETVIQPALREGKWVICDRFFESSFVYQGFMGVSDEKLLSIHQLLHAEIKVDHHFLFTGKVGKRTYDEQDHMDHFCNENRAALEKRVILFSETLPKEEVTLIQMKNQDRKEVRNQILNTLLFR